MWPVFAATEAQIPAQAPSDRPDKPDNPIVLPLPEDSYCRAGVREADVRFVRFVRLHVGRVFVDKLHQKDPEEPTDKPDKTDNPFLRRREKNPLPLFAASPRWCRGPRIEISKLPDRQWHRPPSQARFRLRASAGAARCSRTRSWTSSPPRAPCPRGWCWPQGRGRHVGAHQGLEDVVGVHRDVAGVPSGPGSAAISGSAGATSSRSAGASTTGSSSS